MLSFHDALRQPIYHVRFNVTRREEEEANPLIIEIHPFGFIRTKLTRLHVLPKIHGAHIRNRSCWVDRPTAL